MTVVVTTTGRVKFFDQAKGFGFITTSAGDIFVNAKVAGDKAVELVAGVEVKLNFINEYRKGTYTKTVDSILSVKAAPRPVTVLDTVIWFNEEKGFGFINCSEAGLSKPTALLHMSVCIKAGIVLGEGRPMCAVVIESEKGPKVLSFQWGEAVEAEWQAKMADLYAEDGAVVEATEVVELIAAAPEAEVAAPEATPKPMKAKAAPKKAAVKPKTAAPKKLTTTKAPVKTDTLVAYADPVLLGAGVMAATFSGAAWITGDGSSQAARNV